MGDRYELVQPNSYDNKARLMVEDGTAILLPNSMRRCTDCLCTIIFTLFFIAFWALLIYSIISGSYLSVVSIYNGDAIRCNTQPEFTCT